MKHSPLLAALLPLCRSVAAYVGSDSGPVDHDVDVAVLGGGSGGIHAAMQLKDAGARVLVIEKKDQIGGHAETYIDQQTGVVDNIGVILFESTDVVKRYFARLGVQTATANPLTSMGTSQTYDFSLGLWIPPMDPLSKQQQQQAVQSAAQTYSQNVLSKYSWIDQGYFVPDPVPDELAMPFSDFASKYNFSALLPVAGQVGWYFGNQTTVPALYGIKDFGPGLLNATFGAFIMSGTGNTRSLYDAALKELGSDVLLSATVLDVQRQSTSTRSDNSTGGITLRVAQPDSANGVTTIRAKKLLVAFPPTQDNLQPLDLTPSERSLFSRFTSLAYFTGVARVPGWGARVLTNVGAFTPLHQPRMPGSNVFRATSANTPDDFSFGVGFDDGDGDAASAEDGEVVVRRQLANLAAVGAVPMAAARTVSFPASSLHAPFNMRVSAEDIKSGFYGKLLALQGQKDTYWTGAAWAGQNSALVWNFNEGTVVPGLKKDLGLK